jgi:hypothetical protein
MYSFYSIGRNLLAVICIACLGSVVSLNAQVEEPQIDADFSFYLIGFADANRSLVYLDEVGPSQPLEFYLYRQAGTPQLITVPPGESSEVISYSGPQALSLYRSIGVDEFGEPILEKIAQGTLPENWKGGTIGLLPEEDGLRFFPFERKLTDRTKNTALLMNISDVPVLCKAMDEMIPIAPYQSTVISLDKVNSDLQLNLKCAIHPGETGTDDWRLVYSGSQTVLRNQYYIFLLVGDERQKSYRLVRFRGE